MHRTKQFAVTPAEDCLLPSKYLSPRSPGG